MKLWIKDWIKKGVLLTLLAALAFVLAACTGSTYILPDSVTVAWGGAAVQIGENEYELAVGETSWTEPGIPTPENPERKRENSTYKYSHTDIELSRSDLTHCTYTTEYNITALAPGTVTIICTPYYYSDVSVYDEKLGRNATGAFSFTPVEVVFHFVEKKGTQKPAPEPEPVPEFKLEYDPKAPDAGMEIQMTAAGLTPEQAAKGKWSVSYVELHNLAKLPDAGSPISKEGRFMIYQPCIANVSFEYSSKVEKEILYVASDFTMTLSPGAVQLKAGDTQKLQSLFKGNSSTGPYTGTTEGDWVSSNPSVAVVDKNGVVTAIAPGKAEIAFQLRKFNENGYFRQASCPVTVESPPSEEKPDGGKEEPVTHTVTFIALGDTPWSTLGVTHNASVPAPAAPQRQGYEFTGWYDKREQGALWDFGRPVTADMTLYAQWRELPSAPALDGPQELYGIEKQPLSVDYSVISNYEATLELESAGRSLQGVSVSLTKNEKGGYTLSLPNSAPPGKHIITLRANNLGKTSLFYISLEINPPLSLKPLGLPQGKQNAPYLQQLTPSGGRGPYTFTALKDLPDGLKLEKDTIAGTPVSKGGSYPVSIRMTDADGHYLDRNYSLRLFHDVRIQGAGQITLTEGETVQEEYTLENPGGAAMRIGNVNEAGAELFSTGGDTYLLEISSDLSQGRYDVRLESDLWEASKEISVLVHSKKFVPVQEITGLPAYALTNRTLSLKGKVQPPSASAQKITWSFVDPVQMYAALTPDGKLTTYGMGGADLEIRATIKDGIYGGDYTQDFTLRIEYDIDLDPLYETLPFTAAGEQADIEFCAINGAGAPYIFAMAPGSSLPPGLALEPTRYESGFTSARLIGKPTQKGDYPFTLRVFDKDENYKDFTWTLQVNGPPELDLKYLPGAYLNEPYENTFSNHTLLTASGGMGGPYGFMVTQDGALPPGLTLLETSDNTAIVEGTPTALGNYPFKIRVSDKNGTYRDYSYAIDVTQYENPNPVKNITSLRKTLIIGQSCQLTGNIEPTYWDNVPLPKTTIKWSFNGDPPPEGFVTLENGVLQSNRGTGKVKLRATICNGAAKGDYVKNFTVEIVDHIELSGTFPNAKAGQAYEEMADHGQMPEITGGAGIDFRIWGYTAGTIPPEMTVSVFYRRDLGRNYLYLKGTPQQAGTYEMKLMIADTDDNIEWFTVPITVEPSTSRNSIMKSETLVPDIPAPSPAPEHSGSLESTDTLESTETLESAETLESTGTLESAEAKTDHPEKEEKDVHRSAPPALDHTADLPKKPPQPLETENSGE